MPDIKTKKENKGTIKTLDKAKIVSGSLLKIWAVSVIIVQGILFSCAVFLSNLQQGNRHRQYKFPFLHPFQTHC